jgi:iron(III) transport system substrate-binding protein
MGRSGIRKSTPLTIAVTASILLVAGCSSSSNAGSNGGSGSGSAASGSASGSTDFATMPLDQLYQKAKAEGTFTFYGDGHAIPDLYKIFTKTYPGIKLNEVDDQDSTLAVRAQAEASAGKVVADAWGSPTESLDALVAGGLVEKMTNVPEAAAFPAEDKTDYWVGKETQPDGICYNTDKVPAADAPKTWNDLADPKYKKYSIGVDPDAWIVLLAYAEKKYGGDKSKAEDVFKSIASTNKLVPGTGGRALVNSLVSGDIDIDMNCNVYIEAASQKDGAPVAMSKGESVPEPVGIAVMKGAPHPAAAWLIVRWELSDAGQQAYAAIGRVPGNTNIKPSIDVATTNQYFVAPDVVSQSAKDYAADWKQIFDLH